MAFLGRYVAVERHEDNTCVVCVSSVLPALLLAKSVFPLDGAPYTFSGGKSRLS